MVKADAIVIGAGTMGGTIARALMRQGREVVVLDCNDPMAATPASSCLMNPAWYSGFLSPEQEKWSLDTLEAFYGLHTIKFYLPLTRGTVEIRWSDARSRVGLPIVNDTAQVIGKGGIIGVKGLYEAPMVVIAAGSRTSSLIDRTDVVGKVGAAFLVQGRGRNSITPWAPYKQVVTFEQPGGTFWTGDGSAILEANWTPERERRSLDRSRYTMDSWASHEMRVGSRPFVKGKKFLLEKRDNVWIATGAGKNSTITAGWAATRIAND